MPLTVFHVDDERAIRGGERQLIFLAEALRLRGHQNVIVCRADSSLDREAAARRFRRLHLPFLTEFDPVSAWKLRKSALAAERPLFHAHTATGAAVSFMAAEGARLPRIVHRRTDAEPAKGLDFVLRYRRASRVVAVSNFVRGILTRAGLPEEKIAVVRDAAPPDASPEEHGSERAYRQPFAEEFEAHAGALWIGTLGALQPDKDHATLLKAYAAVRRQYAESYLLIAGEGPLFPDLLALAKNLQVEEHVRFLGFRPDSLEVMKTLDLYVQASLNEGLGSVLLEAMACGVPVVATMTGGIPEIVAHRKTGILATPGEPERLAQAIFETLGDPEGTEARVRAATARLPEFSVGRLADQIETVYASCEDGAS